METKEIGAGTYPEPKEEETRIVKLQVSFRTEVEVPAKLENYSDIKEYIETVYSDLDLLEYCEKFLIDDIEK